MIITIDGRAGTGKSTVAKRLAKALGFTYFDTGAMYRSLTYIMLEKKLSLDGVDSLLEDFEFRIEVMGDEKYYIVGEQDITDNIRSADVNRWVSQVAKVPAVRSRLVDIQRDFGKNTDAVFEGRDLGTVVFPDAELKFFLTASPKVRAIRRYEEMQSQNPHIQTTVEEVLAEIENRDHLDTTREISPLRKAEDAICIDTSHISIEEVVQEMLKYREHTRH